MVSSLAQNVSLSDTDASSDSIFQVSDEAAFQSSISSSQLWLLPSLPPLFFQHSHCWVCVCTVDTVRLRRTAVSLCHLSPVLSLHLLTTLRCCLSFCLFLSSTHLYHPSSVVSSKTHVSSASPPRHSFTHPKFIQKRPPNQSVLFISKS